MTAREYTYIGKLFLKHQPDQALRYLRVYNPSVSLALLPIYFTKANVKSAYERRIFIGVMLKLYCPQVFTDKDALLPKGFVAIVSSTTGQHSGNTSRAIDCVIAWRSNTFFMDQVEELQAKLKISSNGTF